MTPCFVTEDNDEAIEIATEQHSLFAYLLADSSDGGVPGVLVGFEVDAAVMWRA